jgi:hypothetical protein
LIVASKHNLWPKIENADERNLIHFHLFAFLYPSRCPASVPFSSTLQSSILFPLPCPFCTARCNSPNPARPSTASELEPRIPLLSPDELRAGMLTGTQSGGFRLPEIGLVIQCEKGQSLAEEMDDVSQRAQPGRFSKAEPLLMLRKTSSENQASCRVQVIPEGPKPPPGTAEGKTIFTL